MDSVVEVRNGSGKRHQKSQGGFFFLYFEGEIKKDRLELMGQAVSYERQNWRASEVDRAMQRWLRRRN